MNDNRSDRYTENYLISFADAKKLIIENSSATKTTRVSVDKALGRVLATPLFSPTSVPPFNNSAMDGYAVNASDLVTANKTNPVKLEVIGLTAAGDAFQAPIDTREKAWKIMTGAPVPDGFDSIIPVENTQTEKQQVFCYTSPEPGEHIRQRGEDFGEGEIICSSGKIINANIIMACAALGITHVEVYQEIDVAIFSTGKELVNDPMQALKPGQIRNSNQPFIYSVLQDTPVNVYDGGTNYDNVEKFEHDLRAELDKNTQVIISSGAVSMGDFDFIPQVIKKLGGEIIFHKAKIRPGKPVLFARFSNGSFYFGLPGNPISAAIGLRFFVSTLLRNMLGLPEEKPLTAYATNGLKKKMGFRSILKASAQVNQQAKLEVSILEGQESFKIKPLLTANGWAVIKEEVQNFSTGDLIEYYPSSIVW